MTGFLLQASAPSPFSLSRSTPAGPGFQTVFASMRSIGRRRFNQHSLSVSRVGTVARLPLGGVRAPPTVMKSAVEPSALRLPESELTMERHPITFELCDDREVFFYARRRVLPVLEAYLSLLNRDDPPAHGADLENEIYRYGYGWEHGVGFMDARVGVTLSHLSPGYQWNERTPHTRISRFAELYPSIPFWIGSWRWRRAGGISATHRPPASLLIGATSVPHVTVGTASGNVASGYLAVAFTVPDPARHSRRTTLPAADAGVPPLCRAISSRTQAPGRRAIADVADRPFSRDMA